LVNKTLYKNIPKIVLPCLEITTNMREKKIEAEGLKQY
jgi:hypothetical protein